MNRTASRTSTASSVPPELVGREVGVRVLAPLWDAARARRIDPQRLIAGTGCSLSQLTDNRERISWEAFARFVQNLGALIGDDELVALGAKSISSPLFQALLVPGRLLFGITEIYRWVFGTVGPATQMFAALHGTIFQVGPNRLRLESRMKRGYQPSRENHLLLCGSLQGLSGVLGAGPARVTLLERSDGVAFDIELPAERGVLRTLGGAVSWVFAAKSAGEELRRAHLELYERYVELQREIEARSRTEEERRRLEEQLRQTQKMEAIGRLAGGVAHDFNNLLSVILSYTSLVLERTRTNATVQGELKEIQKAGLRAADLTRQLLSFSRHEVINPRVLDLGQIVAEMDDMLRRLVGADIELTTHAPAGLGKVKADPGHIEQVIMNLVVNARDAMPHGGRLTLETANVELDAAFAREHLGVVPGRHVMLAVSDTGVGMDKAVQERIFDPFFTTKEHGKGTGLGLSIVFGIAKQSGGSVWVYSELGKGSTFKLYLPRTDDIDTGVSPAKQVGSRSGSETILLVEDNEQLRVVARGVLQRSGYRVLEAADGVHALQVSAAEPGAIDLLLTDVVMPKMNGRELADRITRERPALRVLYMSGYTEGGVIHHGVVDAATSLLQKPITPDSLLSRVREALDARDAVSRPR